MMRIGILPGRHAVCRLDPAEAIPSWADGDGFVSITRTSGELSIVCEESRVPDDVRAERGYRCLGVKGPIPFELTGVAASLAAPLAAAGISLLLIATYDTDYLLVREELLEQATAALRAAGHAVASS